MLLPDGRSPLAELVLESMREGVAVHDAAGHLVEWNAAVAAITGWGPEEAGAEGLLELPEGLVELALGCWVDLRRRRLGKGRRGYTVTLLADARERVALRAAEALLAEVGTADPLTGLPSRAAGQERLSQAVALGRREYLHVGLLYVDVDRFGSLNDLLGQEGGDELLRLVARRLRDHLRESDTASRFGGDEFAVVLASLARPEDALTAAERLLDELSKPYPIDERDVIVRFSIGVAVFPKDGFEAGVLLRNAEAAMEKAKVAGGNACRALNGRPQLRVVPGLAAER